MNISIGPAGDQAQKVDHPIAAALEVNPVTGISAEANPRIDEDIAVDHDPLHLGGKPNEESYIIYDVLDELSFRRQRSPSPQRKR
jgi:hypothetical protein